VASSKTRGAGVDILGLLFRLLSRGSFDPGMRHLFPDTPGAHEWFTEANRTDMLTKPYQKSACPGR
jgi:hypothetical protein